MQEKQRTMKKATSKNKLRKKMTTMTSMSS